MTFSIALEVGIGLMLLFLILSLLVTAINELVAQFLSLRAKHLESALKQLLDLTVSNADTANLELFNAVLHSPTLAIAGGVSKTKRTIARPTPSYINRDTFVAALREAIPTLREAKHVDASVRDLGTLIDAMPDNARVKRALKAAIGDMSHTAQDVEKRVGDWFDGMMERGTGAYKRWMSTLSLLIGMALAVALNADSLFVATSLAHSAAARAEIVKVAENVTRRCTGDDGKPALGVAECTNARQNLDALQALPLGWSRRPGALSIIGWLITGFAVSLGAPFWFDLLSKVMNVRSSLKPEAPSSTATEK